VPDASTNTTSTTVQEGYYDSMCTYGGEKQDLELGDSIEICAFLSTIPPQKRAYKIVVDEYTSLTLKGSHQDAVADLDRDILNGEGERPVYSWVATPTIADSAHALDC